MGAGAGLERGGTAMILSTREDIEAPIEEVFAALTDFDGYERAALRRGAEVARIDQPRQPGVGQTWKAAFDYRGKRRQVTLRLITMDRPTALRFAGLSATLDADMTVDLVALSRRRTRVSVAVALSAKTLASRIFLQSLRLTKGRVNERFAARIRGIAVTIDDRLRKPTLG